MSPILSDYVIVGDEAFTLEEYIEYERRRRMHQQRQNERRRMRRATDPEYRDHWNAYQREYKRARRAA